MITVRQSRLTKHWIVEPGTTYAEGFRRWEDAYAEADRRADRYRICGEGVLAYPFGAFECTRRKGHDGDHDNPAFWDAVS